MAKELEWKTELRKISDLVPFEINPRKISDEKKAQLVKFIQTYNVVEIPVVNKDGKLITWNQRLSVMMLLGRGDEMVDVRVPNRKLTEKEVKEYNLIANNHSGEWDMDLLKLNFDEIDFASIGLDLTFPEEKETPAKEYDPNTQWFLNIKCTSEQHAQELYERFLLEGLEVKIVT